jgi:hypothetical protein
VYKLTKPFTVNKLVITPAFACGQAGEQKQPFVNNSGFPQFSKNCSSLFRAAVQGCTQLYPARQAAWSKGLSTYSQIFAAPINY